MGIGTPVGGASGVTGGVTGVPVAGAAGVGATAGTGVITAGTAAPPMGGAPAGGTGAPPAGTGGMGGAPPAGGMGGSPDIPDAGTPQPDAMVNPGDEDLGEGDGHDVITIGDSWMNLGLTGIEQSLVEASGQPYRTYGVAGTRMLNGQIPGQYTTAKREDPDIKTVVMTGGGNDVLLTGLSGACASGTMSCRTQLEAITAEFTELWTMMAADGVRDVILIHYASDAGDGLNPSLMHIERLMTACGGVPAPLRCHLMLTDDIVMGQYQDGVHPTAAAYDRLGQAAYDLMVAEGMRR